MRGEGSAGGHHGLESIIAALHAMAFPRLRVGIGVLPPRTDAVQFVLSPFTHEEGRVMEPALQTAVAAVDVWLEQGLTIAMNQCNRTRMETTHDPSL